MSYYVTDTKKNKNKKINFHLSYSFKLFFYKCKYILLTL